MSEKEIDSVGFSRKEFTLQLSTKPYEELEGLIYDLTQKN
jgi:hypothetical protein